MKQCTKCKKPKTETEFSKQAKGRDGIRSYCKACAASYGATLYAANADKTRARIAKYRAENPEKVRACIAKWNVDNADRVKAKTAAYRAANPDKVKAAQAKWYKENTAKAKVITARWAANNPEARRIQKHNRRARERENGGKLSVGLTEKLHKLQRGKCACGCKKPLGDDYHLDHRIPIMLGGANEDWNIQLLRATCNHQKCAKDPIDFMRQRGYLL